MLSFIGVSFSIDDLVLKSFYQKTESRVKKETTKPSQITLHSIQGLINKVRNVFRVKRRLYFREKKKVGEWHGGR
jgi:hypothetical protein